MTKAKEKETISERLEREKQQQLIDNRRSRFTELLGSECEFIDALVVRTQISPWDVKELLDKGCDPKLIPEILF